MKWLSLVLCLLLSPLLLGAEPMKHPSTGEEGFWVSKAQMQETVFQLEQASLCEEALVALRISMQEATETIDKLKLEQAKTFAISMVTATIGIGLAVYGLSR